MKSGRPLDTLYVRRQSGGSAVPLIARAKAAGVVVKEVDGKKLDSMCKNESHQGIIAVAALKEYAELEDLFNLAQERGEKPFFIVCDELTDPHNLGAVIRTACCTGAHGVIVPKRNSAGLNYTVGKASAGAVEFVPVARVANIVNTLKKLKERGLWIYAADMDGTDWCTLDYSGAAALVIGSEGNGIGRLVKEHADFIVSLPMKGSIDSLNASVAAGVVCYEIARQRSGLRAINP